MSNNDVNNNQSGPFKAGLLKIKTSSNI